MQIQRLEREIEILRRGGESELTRQEAIKNSERSERLLGDRLHHVMYFCLISQIKLTLLLDATRNTLKLKKLHTFKGLFLNH
jgi:hypothetical protein